MIAKHLSWWLGRGSRDYRGPRFCLGSKGAEEAPPGRSRQALHVGSGSGPAAQHSVQGSRLRAAERERSQKTNCLGQWRLREDWKSSVDTDLGH